MERICGIIKEIEAQKSSKLLYASNRYIHNLTMNKMANQTITKLCPLCKTTKNASCFIRPGDAIRANVLIEVNYGYDREVVSTNYRIITVDEVIDLNPNKQISLFNTE